MKPSKTAIFQIILGLSALCFTSNAISAGSNLQFAAPYYMTPQSSNGVHFEVLKAAFEKMEYDILPLYVPIARIYPMLIDQKVDGAFLEGATEQTYLYPSQAYTYYLNAVAVTLQETKLNINSPADLKNYSVIAFQNASKLLGKAFKSVAKGNSNYKEKADQESQVRMLYSKRAQVIVLADTIFAYYKSLLPETYFKMPVEIHYFLGKEGSPVNPIFVNDRFRKTFEEGMTQLKESGEYDKILEKWKNKTFESTNTEAVKPETEEAPAS